MRIRTFLALAALTYPMLSSAATFPIEAKTGDGKTVMLYEDGTWRPKTLQLDHSVIRKGQFATKMVASRFGFYEFWYDPNAWVPGPAAGAFEHLFTHKDEEAWCGIIPERIGMTKEALGNAVLSNLKSTDPEGALVQRSKAFVNGLGGEVLELKATVDGYFVSYYSFIWTGARGTVQVTCWTGQSLMDEYRDAFHDFYGGFVLVD